MNCCSQFECMDHIHKIIKSYWDLNNRWFLITLLSFKTLWEWSRSKLCFSRKWEIPAGSTHAFVRPCWRRNQWRLSHRRLHLCSNKTTREKGFIATDYYWLEVCINMQQYYSFQKKSASQSVLLLVKYSHERVKVSQFSCDLVIKYVFYRRDWVSLINLVPQDRFLLHHHIQLNDCDKQFLFK